MEYTIVAESEVKCESGSYPYSIVLAQRTNPVFARCPFVTWASAQRDSERSLSGGHYDLTLTEACADYQERCKAYGLKLGQAFGPAIRTFEIAGAKR